MARPKSNLSLFIESLPGDLPVKQVVARAKEAGFTTSESNVQRVRYLARKGSKAPKAAAKPAAPKAAAKPAAPKAAAKPAAKPSSDEATFRRLALTIGLDRADALLAGLREQLLKLALGGGHPRSARADRATARA